MKLAAISSGLAVGACLVALAIAAYTFAPRGWNKDAITSEFVSADFNPSPSPAVYYTYTLTNNTSKDFSTKLIGEKQLPENLRAAARRGPIYDDPASVPKVPTAPSLNFGDINFYTGDVNVDESIERLANGEPLFIPAKQKVQIRLRWQLPYMELAKHSSVSILNTSLFGFILYDDATKFEVDFSKPPMLQGKATELDVAQAENKAIPIAPDHAGKPWEKYAACAEAARLAPSCSKASIEPTASSFVKEGWVQTPLPEMSLPPKGYLLQPDQKTCDIAFQWQTYCKTQK